MAEITDIALKDDVAYLKTEDGWTHVDGTPAPSPGDDAEKKDVSDVDGLIQTLMQADESS